MNILKKSKEWKDENMNNLATKKITLKQFINVYYMDLKVFNYNNNEIKYFSKQDTYKTIRSIEMGDTNTLWIFLDK